MIGAPHVHAVVEPQLVAIRVAEEQRQQSECVARFARVERIQFREDLVEDLLGRLFRKVSVCGEDGLIGSCLIESSRVLTWHIAG